MAGKAVWEEVSRLRHQIESLDSYFADLATKITLVRSNLRDLRNEVNEFIEALEKDETTNNGSGI
jgi:prefoldin subunit 5